jgi:hypothetical protein
MVNMKKRSRPYPENSKINELVGFFVTKTVCVHDIENIGA